jgi:UDP-2,3-diacylglucosamine pyrophosphatase LpxH
MRMIMQRREFIRKAATLGLVATAPAGPLFAAPATAAVARGHVVADKRPVAGVSVSDGCRVVSTDAAGQFVLPIGPDSGPFVFITIPSGYWTDRFFVPTAEAARKPPVFNLQTGQRDEQHTAVYLTDVHLGEGHADTSYRRFAATIDEINGLDPLPAVCWVGGDITLQGGKGEWYVALMTRLKMPVRNAVGNHEMLVKESDPRDRFGRLFGPSWYSFDIGNVHYVTLDGCHINRAAEGFKNVEGKLSRRELNWLAEDLRRAGDHKAKVVSIHIPLVSDYPQRRGTTAEKVPYWVIQNAEEVVDLLAQHGVSLVLQGHLHENQRSMRKGIEFVESVSVCGRWWKTDPRLREHGVSGEPRGYRILNVAGSTVRHRYLSSAEARNDVIGEIVGKPQSLPAGQAAKLAVNIFDPAPEAVVSANVDGGPFKSLPRGGGVCYHENLEPAHHWEWKLPALVRGRHVLTVQLEEAHQKAQRFEHVLTV